MVGGCLFNLGTVDISSDPESPLGVKRVFHIRAPEGDVLSTLTIFCQNLTDVLVKAEISVNFFLILILFVFYQHAC